MKKKIFNVYFNTKEGTFISENKPENLVTLEMDNACSYNPSEIEDFYFDTFCDDVPDEITYFINENEIKLIVVEYVEIFTPFRDLNYSTQTVTVYYDEK